MRKIDHLVYAVPDLEKAMDDFEEISGIRPTFGGYHRTQGTKNAVVNLENGCYLEFLAIDFDNKNIIAPRWMGVDFSSEAQITRWALKSDNLDADSKILKQYNLEMGKISSGERQTTIGQLLKWEMILPLASPFVELAPFMCDWQNSEVHPSDTLPTQCELRSLEFTHPHPHALMLLFAELDVYSDVQKGTYTSIKAIINTPKGVIKL